jgi:ABC-2 type transport system ATP-binding protein
MQQKAQIIAAIVHRPELLIIDEPFTGLDPVNTRLVKVLMRDLCEQGTTILMSTHQMNQVEALCDRILLIDGGRGVLYGALDEIRRRYAGGALLVRAACDLPQVAGTIREPGSNGTVRLRLQEDTRPQDVLERLVALRVPIERFEVALPSLDEIFVHVVAPDLEAEAGLGAKTGRELAGPDRRRGGDPG